MARFRIQLEPMWGFAYEVGDTLRRFQSLGFQDFIVMFPYGHDAEMLLRFSETVAPRLD